MKSGGLIAVLRNVLPSREDIKIWKPAHVENHDFCHCESLCTTIIIGLDSALVH